MTPYGTFLFFFIIAILLTPTAILGLNGKRFQTYNIIVSVIMLALIFTSKVSEVYALIFFIIWQVLFIKGYLVYRKHANSGAIFCLAVILAIAPLLFSKLSPLLAIQNLWGFLGISYVTFKAVQMIMEIRDNLIKSELSLVSLLYFLLFFPTISSGPIDRYRRFEKDIKKDIPREEYKLYLTEGINKIFKGFLYKFIIGYTIHHNFLASLSAYGAHTRFLKHLFFMYGYSFYLFFDFAGYSAFAVGVSYIMGIKTPENFNKPFISRNMKDFWNRWHITLSFWFRDYVFMRFVFWVHKKKLIANRNVTANLGYMLLFLLMGFWHGFALQYIIYGLYQGLLMVGYNTFENFNKKYKWWPDNKWTHIAAVIITFHVVCFGFYIFSGHLIH